MLGQYSFAIANGLSAGAALFLVAAGLTLVFGVLKILNFAHGSFFMVGAYVAYMISGDDPGSIGRLLVASLAAGVVVGLLGLLSDRLIFKRIRHAGHASSLIATFALLLICNGLTKAIWGLDLHSVAPPDALMGSVQLGPVFVPTYSIFVTGLAVVVLIVLDLVMHRLWIGKIVQAVADDSWFSSLSGINVPLLFTGAVIFAFLITGFAGGVLLPNQSLSTELYSSYLLRAFAVVVIGGLGNIRGAFIASMLLGLAENLSAFVLPGLPGLTVYIAMVVFLLWRPQGILGSQNALTDHGSHDDSAPTRALPRPVEAAVWSLVTIVAFSVPFWAPQGIVFAAGSTLIAAMFALSWNFLYGTSGITTFGHAALFAVGAYAVGWLLKTAPQIPFGVTLVVAALCGAVVGGIVAAVALRRAAGLGLAILTLALSEILRVLLSSSPALGRDDGLTAIPRPEIGFGPLSVSLVPLDTYYWFLAAVSLLFAALVYKLSFSSFGRALNAIRQDPERAAFIGIGVTRYRIAAFALAGAMAAFAGGLSAPWTQIITPSLGGYLNSAQPMLSALLGGAEFFWGPVLGTVVFSVLTYSTRTLLGFTELISGGILLAVVLTAPGGLTGILARLLPAARTASDRPGRLPAAAEAKR